MRERFSVEIGSVSNLAELDLSGGIVQLRLNQNRHFAQFEFC